MAAITMNADVKTTATWTPLIEAQVKAMEEFLVENLKVEVSDEIRREIHSVLDQQTDDFGSLFKTPRKGNGGKKRVADEACRCCALTLKNGAPVRCTRKRADDEGDYCLTHSKQCAVFSRNGDHPKFGRYDEEVPLTFSTYEKGVTIKENVSIAWTSPEMVERMTEAGMEPRRKGKRGRRPRKESSDGASTAKVPKRAPSAYNLYMKDPEVRAKVEGSAKEKMTAIAAMWKEADEETKRPYTEKAAELKAEFNASRDSSDTESVSSGGTPKPKRRNKVSAYKLFKKDNKELGDAPTIKQAWKEADTETKEKYEALVKEATEDAEEDHPILASPVPKKTKPRTPKAPKKAVPEFKMEELETDPNDQYILDPFYDDGGDEAKDISSFPTWLHKKTREEYLVDTEEMVAYDAKTEAHVGKIDALGGANAFYKD